MRVDTAACGGARHPAHRVQHVLAARGAVLEAPLTDLGFKRVRAVGPVAPHATGNRDGETVVVMAAADLCVWLDKFMDKSIVYISFRSVTVRQKAHAAMTSALITPGRGDTPRAAQLHRPPLVVS